MTKSSIFLKKCVVIKSSYNKGNKNAKYLVTRNAGSFTTSGPTLTCPCSTNVVASLMESAIFDLTMTTGSLLRQKHEAVTRSASSRDHLVGINPME